VAAFHIDNDVPVAVAHELLARGHSAFTARDLGLMSAPDPVHLQHAARNNRILVTHNKRDFRLLHQAWTTWFATRAHSGILVIKQQALLAPDMADAIDTFVRTGQPLTNRAYEWKPGGYWESL
jgi:hypothetical protein